MLLLMKQGKACSFLLFKGQLPNSARTIHDDPLTFKENSPFENAPVAHFYRFDCMQVTRSLKEAAKKGDKDVCMILAKEVVHARKTVNKLHAAKVSLIYLHVCYEYL